MRTEQKSMGKRIVEQITGIFAPIINIITAASILKGVIMLLAGMGVLEAESGVYRIFYACSDGFFYFLPFFLAHTASKQWKTDPFISMLIPVTMLYPGLVDLLENGDGTMHFLGIPIQTAVYHSSVLPVLFAIGLLVFLEKGCDRILPDAIKGFTKPILCILVVLPLTFLVFGPMGTLIGNALTFVFEILYEFSPILAIAFLYDKTQKNREKRQGAFQAALAAVLGVTEPALFGVNVAIMRSMITACAAGALGGAMVGAAGTRCSSFAFPSFLTCVVYVGPGFGVFLLSMVVGFVAAFAMIFLQKKKIKKLINEY